MPTVADLFAFENAHPRHTSLKEVLILDELGVKPARYYQLLRRAAESVEGQAADALLAHRISRKLMNPKR